MILLFPTLPLGASISSPGQGCHNSMVQIISKKFVKGILSNAKTKCQCLGLSVKVFFFFFSFFGSVLQYRCVSTSMPDKHASYLSMRHFLKSWTVSNLLLFRNISKCCSQFISGTDVTQKLSYCKDQLRSYRRKYRILLIGLEKVQAAKNATWL